MIQTYNTIFPARQIKNGYFLVFPQSRRHTNIMIHPYC